MPEVTAYEPGVPCWVDLATDDAEGARRFYAALFGWQLEVGPAETGYYAMCRLRGHPVAGISGVKPREDIPTAWTTYLATDDSTADAARITDAGGILAMGPMEIPGQGTTTYALDPAGAGVGLWEAGGHLGATLVNEPGTVTWNELATPDLAVTMDFWSRAFGHTWEPAETGPDSPPYQMFAVGGRAVGGVMQRTDVPPHWMTYFAVGDADVSTARVEELGGTVMSPPAETPFGRNAYVRDPQGAVFAVGSYPTGS